MRALLRSLESSPALVALPARAAAQRFMLGGVSGSARALAIAALAASRAVIAIVPDVAAAEGLEDDLASIASGRRTTLLRPMSVGRRSALDAPLAPDGGDEGFLPQAAGTPDAEARADLSERLAQLAALDRAGAGDIFIVPGPALLEADPRREELDAKSLSLAAGARHDPRAVLAELRAAGFSPSPLVGAPGEVSARGDILDVFPFGEKSPIRVEFFDDTVESIRAFDAETQLSIAAIERIAIPLLRPEQLRGKTPRAVLLHERVKPEVLAIYFDLGRVVDRVEEHAFAHGTDVDRLRRVRGFLAGAPGIELTTPRVDGDGDANLETLSVAGVGGGVESLSASIAELRRRCDRVIVLCESAGEERRMRRLLEEQDVATGDEGAVSLRVGHVREGFQLVAERVAVLNELELLGKPRLHRPRPRRSTVPLRAITNLLELQPGDHLVHQTHGVARFSGMKRMKRDQGNEDFLVLEFDGGTIFYLPAAKIDLVQRYVGPTGTPPRLDKIGGRSWSNKRKKVEAALEEIAFDLLEVQAAREERPGAPHPWDEALIAEFERSFPFADTPDQTLAIADIHRDLGARRPMDRLLCGDVGFGKTELAVRAAFRIVLGGKQVAVLVPTTLLAEQHFQTFERRFASYPVKVAVLSRFRARGETKATIEATARGEIDVVIGTHRLLSKDVAFRDLGLVVVDEEQRFGVSAKEKLKRLKSTVDVLTLTATPIPRTLHMALVGLRDISALNTAPPGRRPVTTEIHRFDDGFLRKSMLAEIDRGGQVFFVHNRVKSLDSVARRIAALVPTAKVVIGHGQMEDDDLDDAIRTFANGDADVLVSTAIIESGLDLPRANTIFVDHPEHFGLADLHQMRGRVGRSDVQAHCHLLVRETVLPEDAQRRLKAIEELSHLGAGYAIAIKDLEIRGAGDLLSAAQSGHISAIGYDLYCRLLAEAVARAKGESPPSPPVDTDVDLGVTAFLPAEYVPDAAQRMEILRRLGAADAAAIAAFHGELRDRFGRIPKPMLNLLEVFAVKRACRELGIRRLLYPGDDHVLVELADPRRFHRHSPFSAREAAMLENGAIHVRLPEKARGPQRALDFLASRLREKARDSAEIAG